MEKWKIILIVVLLGGLAAYGAYQNTPHDPGEGTDEPPPPDKLSPAHQKMLDKPAPKWNIPAAYWTNTSRPINLSDLKGHITVLEFWRAACHHCEEAAPFMTNLYQQFGPRGLKMVAFHSALLSKETPSIEKSWDEVRGVVRKWNLPYPVAYDKGGTLFKTGYHGTTYPMVIVLDRQGKILHIQTGHDEAKGRALMSLLSKALEDKPTPNRAVPTGSMKIREGR